METNLSYNKKGALMIGSHAIKDLASKTTTPFYVLDINFVKHRINQLKFALDKNKLNYRIHYSIKANNNLSLLKSIRKNKLGVDIVSGGELELAKLAEFPSKEIIFAGVGKQKSEILNALERDSVLISVESLAELKSINNIAATLNKKAKIVLRINPAYGRGGHDKITTGRIDDKFGISIDTVNDIFNNLETYKSIDIIGLAMHIGSQIINVKLFEPAFKIIANLFSKINASLSDAKKLKYLNLGGGIGVDYDNDSEPPFKEYAKLLTKHFSDIPAILLLEPGRSLVAESSLLVSSAVFVKKSAKGNKPFLILDAGMHCFMRPALYGQYHNIISSTKNDNLKKRNYTVVGPICESTDILHPKIKLSAEIKENDLFAITKVGAYGRVMASHYNSKAIPDEIVIEENNSVIVYKGKRAH